MKEKLKSEKHHIISNIKKNKIIFKNEKINFNHIIIFIITSIIISSYCVIDLNDLDESKYSYITLKIGQGNNYVYSNTISKKPKIIYINENKQEKVESKYEFKELENSVILIWDNVAVKCSIHAKK